MTTPGSILISRLRASKTNPRKHFDQAAIDELAESIRKHGVLQPILARPIDGKGKPITHEVVAGERRFRAAKAAGLDEIPAVVRTLSDGEALEIQVIENLQRADLAPLEEADGYAALLACTHADGTRYSAEEIAAKVGKSKSYVYQRMRLTGLVPKAREALEAGEIDVSRALLIARFPDAQQVEIFKIAGGPYPMTLARVREEIARRYMLALAQAPFDVRVPYFAGKTSAQPIGPACAECPKRTGNAPDLFDDVKSGDTCTDPACFEAKTEAHVAQDAEAKRAKGFIVLTGKDAKKVFPHEYSSPRGYLRTSESMRGDPERLPLSKRLGKALPPVTLVEHPTHRGEWVRLVKETDAREALVKAGCKWAAKDKDRSAPTAGKAQADDREFQRRVEVAWHKAIREAILEEGLTDEAFAQVVRDAYDLYDIDGEVADFTADLDFGKATRRELEAVLFDCIVGQVYDKDEDRAVIAKLYKVDRKVIERGLKAADKAKAKVAAPAKPEKPIVQIVPLIKPVSDKKPEIAKGFPK
ncbi:MAG: ParB/RepB/Spo0J family partition protein [Betaproteobacteria bacterium]|nr:ParB/RepB/Spo0J family partition protein [Betaproteobacteria bacterium]